MDRPAGDIQSEAVIEDGKKVDLSAYFTQT
jgi:hypothetical protein